MKKVFDGPSTELWNTKVVPTLDTQIEKEHSAVWCSSFLAAWKLLLEDIAHDDVSIEGSPQTATLLNKAEDPGPYVPDGSLYAAAGFKQEGVIERIHEGLAAVFPSKPPPSFPGTADDALVAYSYLEANVKFAIPYFQSLEPLEFTDSCGRKTRVASFGIRAEDDYAYYKLRSQPRILFRKGEPFDPNLEFAMDLCTESSPSQIIVARINREPTLAAALRRIEKEGKSLRKLRKKRPDNPKYMAGIGPNDILLVPDLSWQVSHRYSELEGKPFTNPNLKGLRLDIAQQDILFRLDRSGAELKSESKIVCLPVPTYFVLDRPFLICMKKREATMPYFAMWVDNAELLTPWTH